MSDAEQRQEFVGASAYCRAVARFVEQVARTRCPVALLGEAGVGKEHGARRIHERSSRRDQPFLMVDCSLYYERELRREVFGYRGGGSSGKVRKGLFEFAAKGTCYLSRVEELSPLLQRELLEFLRVGRFRRLGDGREIASDVRLVVSSEKNLEGFVTGGLFDAGLWAELSASKFELLPLRERTEDVRPLVEALALDITRGRCGSDAPVFSSDVLEALSCFPWPGNIDELRTEVAHLVEKGVREITTEHLSFEVYSYWVGRRGDPDVRRVIEELDGYIREFRVLTRLDAEFGDVLLHVDEWDAALKSAPRQLGEQLL